MPAIQVESTVAANSTNTNLVSGSAFEFARQRQVVSIGITAAATGTFSFISSGADVILEESATYIKTQFPIIPDEMFYNDVMEAGDRLVIRVRNTTGAGIIVRAIILSSPV
jgi:hypothetical protein